MLRHAAATSAALSALALAATAAAAADEDDETPRTIITTERNGEVVIVTSNGVNLVSPAGTSIISTSGDEASPVILAGGVGVRGEVIVNRGDVKIVSHANGAQTVIAVGEDGRTSTVTFSGQAGSRDE